MQLINIFTLLTQNLIEIMFCFMLLALTLRFFAYKVGRKNQAYFNTFSRSIVKLLEDEEAKNESVNDVEEWLDTLLDNVTEHLPDRSIRFKRREKHHGNNDNRLGVRIERERLKDYTAGKRSIVISLKQQVDAFKSPYPPNFMELSDRVLDQDKNWRTILKIIPVDSLSRMLDILPSLFIVGGIFGTFIGITAALPLIASIDLANMAEASPILNKFVAHVAYSMNTSIAGIIFSVIMTILIALFPITSLRDDVSKNLEEAMEFIWHRINGNKLSHGERKIIEALGSSGNDVVAVLEKILMGLSKNSIVNIETKSNINKAS